MKTHLDTDEVALLENQATNIRDKLLIRMLFHLGCRVSEALGLTLDSVDLVQDTVTIQHLKTRIRLVCPQCSARLARNYTYCPACGIKVEDAVTTEKEHRRMRTLPVDKDTLAMLDEYIRRGGCVLRNDQNFIFGINRHRAWQIVRDCAIRAALPKLLNPETGRVHNVSPHRLRDAFAVHAVKMNDSGDGLRLLQEHLGHQSFNTTAKYRKVSGEEHRDWFMKLWDKEDGDSKA